MNLFPLHLADFYKVGHPSMIEDNAKFVLTNFTPRSLKYLTTLPDHDGKTVVFGLQGVLNEFNRRWEENFFDKPKEKVVAKYKRRLDIALGQDAIDVKHIEDLWDLGYLPIRIMALPEGVRTHARVPHFVVMNTHPDFVWIATYVETQLSADYWPMTTVATISFEFRRLFEKYARVTGSPLEFVPWQFHDFSFRGLSGCEDAARKGSAHLTSSLGTDTIVALDYLEENYYGEETFLGGSVSATEHMVMCQLGREQESTTYKKLINKFDTGILSIVSDTWDYWNVLDNILPSLKEDILARKVDAIGNGKVVIRPDSGNPLKIICGDPEAPEGSLAREGSLEILWRHFGGTVNESGYRVLNPRIGLIYGDSINLKTGEEILQTMKMKGFASCNIVFGIGSFTYNMMTRDTLGCAIKATYMEFADSDGNTYSRNLLKDPVTDDGTKKSATGLLGVFEDFNTGDLVLHEGIADEEFFGDSNMLKVVYQDSTVLSEEKIATIRERLAMQIF